MSAPSDVRRGSRSCSTTSFKELWPHSADVEYNCAHPGGQMEIPDNYRRRKGNMATPAWNVSGQYYETCNCDFVCPCVPGQLAVRPTKGDCQFAMAFQIEHGTYGAVSLDGLGFIVLGLTPEEMGKGNWSVGLVTDARATAEQRDAMTAIASGAAGGPMAALSGLIGKFLGVESAPIAFDRAGAKWSVKALS